MDESKARGLAFDLDLPVLGAVGLLLAAKRQGIVPLVRPFLERFPDIQFWASATIVRRALRDADEIDSV